MCEVLMKYKIKSYLNLLVLVITAIDNLNRKLSFRLLKIPTWIELLKIK